MTSYPPARSDSRLTFTHPPHLCGWPVYLAGVRSVLGRDPTCDIRLDDPYVSGTHAALNRLGRYLVLEDLGSANGTCVNNQPLNAPRTLQNGDVFTLGHVGIRYDAPGIAPQGGGRAVEGTVLTPMVNRAPRFDVGQQHGAHINNVGGHQYIDQRQESFLRQIAAARTRAKRIVLFGLALFAVGFAFFAWGVLRFLGRIGDTPEDPKGWPTPKDMLGSSINGVPIFLFGWAAALLGVFLMVIGLVMHIVTASRRRTYEAAVSRRY